MEQSVLKIMQNIDMLFFTQKFLSHITVYWQLCFNSLIMQYSDSWQWEWEVLLSDMGNTVRGAREFLVKIQNSPVFPFLKMSSHHKMSNFLLWNIVSHWNNLSTVYCEQMCVNHVYVLFWNILNRVALNHL